MSKSSMFFSLVVLAALAVLIAWDIYETRRLIAIGVDLSKKAVPFSRSDSGPKILVVGDSTAVGTGASSGRTSLAGLLGAYYPSASITNLGVNGSKTRDLLARGDLEKGEFDLLVIHIGGNDTVRFTDLTELEKDIRLVLELAKKRAKHVVLVSTGNVGTARLLPFGTRWAFTIRTRQVRDIFMQASAEAGIMYVDLFRETVSDPFAHDPEKYYAADFFHPSDAGYADWFGLIRKQLPLELSSEDR